MKLEAKYYVSTKHDHSEGELIAPLDNAHRRFLLGIANEDEQQLVEEAILTGQFDSSVLDTAEDELIDDYLLGNLSQVEKRGFEEQFLITEQRQQRLRFASELIRYSNIVPPENNSVNRKASLAGMSVIYTWKRVAILSSAASVLLTALVGSELIKLRHQTEVVQEMQRGDQLPGIEVQYTTRTVSPQVFRVPVQARFARIDWKLSQPLAGTYREVLLSASGRRLWSQEFSSEVLSPADRSTMVVPASILGPGTYHLRLEGDFTGGQFEELADSVFLVVRE